MTTFQDARYAIRQLRKSPAFTLTVLLTLALGIGANAAIFTLVNAVMLRDLPVTDPATLIRVGDGTNCCVTAGPRENGISNLFSTDTYHYLRQNLPEFEDLAAMQGGTNKLSMRRDGPNEQALPSIGEAVSGNYFRTFGLKPAAGRLLTDADDYKGAPLVAVLTYANWQQHYSSDPGVVGSTFWINTKPVTIVGVAPRGYFGDRLASSPPDVYLPIESMTVLGRGGYMNDPLISWLDIIGRARPGVTITPQLQEKVNATMRQSYSSQKDYKGPEGERLLAKAQAPLAPGGAGIQVMKKRYGSNLRLLLWISGLVLLIACANIANLLLVRGMERRTEMSVRTALGAQRMRLVRQMLTESLVLSVMGGLAGLAVAYGGTRMLIAMAFPDQAPTAIHATPSMPVIGFAFALAMLTGVLFGIAPALMAAKAQPADALRTGSRTTASGASLLQRSLVVLQAALSLVLLVGAGLFAQSLGRLEATDLKLDPTNRYIVHFNPQTAGYKATEAEALQRSIADRLHQVPGVVNVALSTYTPMQDNNWDGYVQVQGKAFEKRTASYVRITPEYFDAVGTHLLAGRGIGVQDSSTAPPVAVVNQSFVKEFFHGDNPIGHRFGVAETHGDDYTIVGVVEDTVYTDLRWKDHSMYFLSLPQRWPHATGPAEEDQTLYAATIVIQTGHPMNDMDALTRRTLASINPNLTVTRFQTFSEQIAERFNDDRMITRLTMLFGGLALLLATIGLYGVTAYTVARRTNEIGIRMALGAERSTVVAMVLRGAATQTLTGLAIGIPIAVLSVRFVKSQLYESTGVNATVMGFAIVTLAVAACLAGLIPARRAASINPMQALRMD